MSRPPVRLRRIESKGQLAPAMTLAREYGEWARARAEADYGIVVGSESEGGLSIDLDGLLDTRARLYVAEAPSASAG